MRTLRHRGFSLVESAVSLIVLGLLAIAVVAYWKMSSQQRVAAVERDVMVQAEAALVGFAHAAHRLPCPDTGNDGVEDCGGGQVGNLPWRTLGMAEPRVRGMRYGAYRNSHPNSWMDADLAAARDRFRPLITVSSATSPPAAADTLLGNSNALDFCYALNIASTTAAHVSMLHVVEVGADGANIDATMRGMAFVLALPGLLDADGDGNHFDGNQRTQSAAAPQFDAPSRAQTSAYDDRVHAMSSDTLFARLSCGQALAAAGHSHFNAAAGAAFMQQGLVDYKAQLELAELMAGASLSSAIAGSFSAAAGLTNAVAISATAVAQAVLSYGATSAIVAAGVAAVVANAAAVATSIGTIATATAGTVIAAERVKNVAPLVDRSAALAKEIDQNARAADAAGL